MDLFQAAGAMYGQRSAPIRWENTLFPWLISVGFVQGKNDQSTFYHPLEDITLIVYVDDLLADGDEAAVRHFLDQLFKRFECNDAVFLAQETPIDFIGVIITLHEDQISLSMPEYHEKLLKNMGMLDCNPLGIPFSDQICSSELLDDSAARHYREGVGGIGWLCCTVRPDLAYAFSRLGQHLAKPSVSAMRALKRTLRYIKGTVCFALTAPLDFSSDVNDFQFYSDSDHAGNAEPQNQRKSQSGILATLNGAPVKWKSTAQSAVALSSTEAEIYAASTAIQEFIHLGYVCSELGISGFPSPFQLYVDNAAAEIFMGNLSGVTRMKHIDVRLNWVLQMRDTQIAIPVHIASEHNLADLFTKILAKPRFTFLVEQLIKDLRR
jgi:hypothetical protein